MAIPLNQKFSGFVNGGNPIEGDIIVGLRAGVNTQFIYPGGGGITPWQTVTDPSIAVVGGNGIVTNRPVTPVQVELPETFAVGDEIKVLGLGDGGWTLVCNVGQIILFGSTATSINGSITSDITNANISIRGLVANTTWTVDITNSNPTIL